MLKFEIPGVSQYQVLIFGAKGDRNIFTFDTQTGEIDNAQNLINKKCGKYYPDGKLIKRYSTEMKLEVQDSFSIDPLVS